MELIDRDGVFFGLFENDMVWILIEMIVLIVISLCV